MKLSKLRAKARAAFTHGGIKFRDDQGGIHDTTVAAGQAMAADTPVVEVVVVRRRPFTRPQTALQLSERAKAQIKRRRQT